MVINSTFSNHSLQEEDKEVVIGLVTDDRQTEAPLLVMLF